MKPRKLVHGVGVNDADYVVEKRETNGYQKQKYVWRCPYYRAWGSMIMRCYSENRQERCPTYKGCTVSEEWLTFSNFKAWMEKQDWEGKELDKDILSKGNKIYSPETCAFVTPLVNSFTCDSGSSRGKLLIGVNWDKKTNKFRAKCSNPFTKKSEHLGLFTSEQEAHEAWAKRKLELAKELTSIQSDPRVAKALVERYSKLQISEKGT